jgi:phage antirepressor YoqD-like protein
MALFRRNGKFELEFMNKQDMKNGLIKIKESSEASTAGTIVDGGMRIIPFV